MPKRNGYSRKKRQSDIGRYLTEIRISQGKTQEDVAGILGRTRSCICKIETGKRANKSLQGILLYQLATAYGASIVDILKKAKWAQLPLFNTNAKKEDSTEHDPLLNVTEEERQKLIQYLNEIREDK